MIGLKIFFTQLSSIDLRSVSNVARYGMSFSIATLRKLNMFRPFPLPLVVICIFSISPVSASEKADFVLSELPLSALMIIEL